MAQLTIARFQARRAFTLIELLVVILIVAVLIAVALPAFLGQTQKAQDSSAQQALNTVEINAKALWTGNGQSGFPAGIGPVSTAGTLLYQLHAQEPEMSFVDGSAGSGAGVGTVAVWEPNANEIAACDRSASGTYFCFLDDETGPLTVLTAAPAADRSVFSPAVAQADGVATVLRTVGASEDAASCPITEVVAGASISRTCTGSYGYSTTGWPSLPNTTTSTSAGPVTDTVAASGDAFEWSGNPVGSSGGSPNPNPSVIGTYAVAGSQQQYSLSAIQWTLPTVPTGDSLKSAQVCLTSMSNSGSQPVTEGLFPIDHSWSPNTLTWGTFEFNASTTVAGMASATPAATFAYTGSNTTYCTNVTSLVQSWYNGGQANNGLLLAQYPESSETAGGNLWAQNFNGHGASIPGAQRDNLVLTFG